MSSEGNTAKLKAREPDAVAIWRLLTVTATKPGPKPRTAIWLDSPPLRLTDTPGTRCKASATLGSGNLPASSAETESTTLMASRLIDCARRMAESWPVTDIAAKSTTFLSSAIFLMSLRLAVGVAGANVAVLFAGVVVLVCACACTPWPSRYATPIAASAWLTESSIFVRCIECSLLGCGMPVGHKPGSKTRYPIVRAHSWRSCLCPVNRAAQLLARHRARGVPSLPP